MKLILVFPAILAGLNMLVYIIFIRYDTPKFLVEKGKINDAKAMLSKIYVENQAEIQLSNL